MTEVRSAWLSKINWTQAVTSLAMVLSWLGIDMPPDVRAAVITGIAAIGQVATWILRTWFTTTLTPGSVEK